MGGRVEKMGLSGRSEILEDCVVRSSLPGS